MPETVSIQYGDLFEFLEDYRTNISQLSYSVGMPTTPLEVGDDVVLQITVPVMDEVVAVHGRVMAPMGDRAGLQLNPDDGDGLPRLEGFYRFVGRLVESMLVSGRFKVTGQWASGAAPAGAPRAAAAPAGAPAPPSALDLPAASLNGTMGRKELTELFMQLYREKAMGVLQVQGPQGLRRAWMKQGGIVAWESEPVIEEECLGVLLARAGKITEEQLKQTLQMMNETGMKQGECLIEMGVFTFPQVVMSLMTQVELITRNVFSEGTGTWSFHPMPALLQDFVTPPLKSPGFLFKFFKRHFSTMPADELTALEAPLMDRYTVLSDYNWDDFRLSKTERALVDILSNVAADIESLATNLNTYVGVQADAVDALGNQVEVVRHRLALAKAVAGQERLEDLRARQEPRLSEETALKAAGTVSGSDSNPGSEADEDQSQGRGLADQQSENQTPMESGDGGSQMSQTGARPGQPVAARRSLEERLARYDDVGICLAKETLRRSTVPSFTTNQLS